MKIINIRKLWAVVLSVFFISFMTACSSGHDGESDETTGVVGENAQLSVVVTNNDGNVTNSITSGDTVVITATLTDSSGAAIEGQNVDFTSNLGSLNSSSRLSDSNGQASVSFDSSDVETGVVTITTSTTVSTETLTFDSQFEVLANVVEEQDPSITLSLKQSGEINSTGKLKETEEAQLSVLLLDADDNPIPQIIVSFSAELGTLQQTSALTGEDGLAEATLTANADELGAGVATASVEIGGIAYSDTLLYEVIEADATTINLSIGHFDETNTFIDGVILSEFTDDNGDTQLNAGSSIDLTVALVDENGDLHTDSAVVTFRSECSDAGLAELNSEVTTQNGEAKATFKDLSCANSGDVSDTIVASITTNSVQRDASLDIDIAGEPVNSVRFIGASPQNLVVKGTGGVGNAEESTLTFLVTSSQGNPLPNKTVNFELNTDTGGLSLSASSDVTAEDGTVTVQVTSGTVPTVVRVTASVTENDQTFSTQSDLLSINTGLPDQNSITIALEVINPEASDENIGEQVQVSAFLADSFNNPVPDGTAVNFTTEGGAIQPSCITTDGNCSVTWTSQEPYTDDSRVTILATAIGHEYYVDVNGNNIFGDEDIDGANTINETLTDEENNEIHSGFGRLSFHNGGFFDLKGAWRDDNENDIYDAGEKPIATDLEGGFNEEDGEFNGPLCTASVCSEDKFVVIRKAVVLITSSSSAKYYMTHGTDIIHSNYLTDTEAEIAIARQTSESFSLFVADDKLQTMPFGTTIVISTTAGELTGDTSFTIPNTRGAQEPGVYGGVRLNFSVANNLVDGDEGDDQGAIQVSITTPKGVVTQFSAPIDIE